MIKNIKGLVVHVANEIRNFTDVAVVGLSGGVDSLCVTALCVHALGRENVYVVHMPYGDTDTKNPLKFNGNSERIAKKLGVKSLNAPIKKIADEINWAVAEALTPNPGNFQEINKVNSGNARSRARMCILYGIVHELSQILEKRARVMGTGNRSEDHIGYDTKGGDALADLFILGELYKSEVYQLVDYFVSLGVIEPDMVDRNPSAGLWENQTDEEELGYTYNEMESGIRFLLKHGINQASDCPITEFVRERHLANKHKHEAPPVIPLRDYCD